MSKEIREGLSTPFREDEIEWRVQSCGSKSNGDCWARVLAYIQARAIQERFDDVLGIENWKVSYRIEPSGFICMLSLRLGGEWIMREDGAEATDIESFKGGISSAFKRVASVFGVGRYLYSLESEFATIVKRGDDGARYGKTKDGKEFYWIPPSLPDWALPVKKEETPPQTKDQYKLPEKKTLEQEVKTTLDTIDHQKRVMDAILGTAEKKRPHLKTSPEKESSPSNMAQTKSPVITALKKDAPRPVETRKPHCLTCGAELSLSPFGYYCKTGKVDKKRQHTMNLKEEELDSFFFNNDPANFDVP